MFSLSSLKHENKNDIDEENYLLALGKAFEMGNLKKWKKEGVFLNLEKTQ